MSNQVKKNDQALRLDNNYNEFLHDIKNRLKTAQIRAALAVNKELIHLYWQMGCDLIKQQKKYKWGDGFLAQFSDDLRTAFPSMQGFSVTNLKRMRSFAKAYPKSPQAVDQMPWGHISYIIQSVKDDTQRQWYAEQTVQNGWSRATLQMQVDSDLYARQGHANKKVTNYEQHLPAGQSGLANELIKDPYNFDFLTVHDQAQERDIEKGLIAHMRKFLLELGKGFAFVGSQVPLTFDDQEFFIDLLFYHLHLRCYVVIELKATKFKPEHTGQLSFYLAAVDGQMKKDIDNPTIGILLCQSKNKIVAEYALKNIKAPIGVSDYKLAKALPEELIGDFPTIEEIETKLAETSKAVND